MSSFAESIVEDAALAWLEALGYSVLGGSNIAARMPCTERSDSNCREVALERRCAMHQCPLQTQLILGEQE